MNYVIIMIWYFFLLNGDIYFEIVIKDFIIIIKMGLKKIFECCLFFYLKCLNERILNEECYVKEIF